MKAFYKTSGKCGLSQHDTRMAFAEYWDCQISTKNEIEQLEMRLEILAQENPAIFKAVCDNYSAYLSQVFSF